MTAKTGGRQDSVRPATAEMTVTVTVVSCRRTRLFYNIKRLISVNKKSVGLHLESRYGSDRLLFLKDHRTSTSVRELDYLRTSPKLLLLECPPLGLTLLIRRLAIPKRSSGARIFDSLFIGLIG